MDGAELRPNGSLIAVPSRRVPDPYYVTSGFDVATESKVIQFVNLPQDAIIRICSSSGVLVALLQHHSDTFGGHDMECAESQQLSGGERSVLLPHRVRGARQVGQMTVVNFAE